MKHGRESWYDDEAGPLVRPYSVTRGRTKPDRYDLNMITLVVTAATLDDGSLDPEYVRILRLCRSAQSIAEISAKLGLPLAVIKILVADLIKDGRLIFRSPELPVNMDPPNMETLQAVLDGIRRL